MKILEQTISPQGIEIQMEDWEGKLTIGAYPIAKNTSQYRWIEGGKKFRLHIPMNYYSGYSNDDVRADFEALKSGEKSLEDLAEHFWNGEKDMWLLGMNVEYKGW